MKIGDLVRMKDPLWREAHPGHFGLVIKQIPGWGEYQTIQWHDGMTGSIEKKYLEIISAGG